MAREVHFSLTREKWAGESWPKACYCRIYVVSIICKFKSSEGYAEKSQKFLFREFKAEIFVIQVREMLF